MLIKQLFPVVRLRSPARAANQVQRIKRNKKKETTREIPSQKNLFNPSPPGKGFRKQSEQENTLDVEYN